MMKRGEGGRPLKPFFIDLLLKVNSSNKGRDKEASQIYNWALRSSPGELKEGINKFCLAKKSTLY